MIRLGKLDNKIHVIYYDKVTNSIFYMSSQIAAILNLDVDQLNEIFARQGGIEVNGLYHFANVDDAKRAKEELENVGVFNAIIGWEF